MLELKVARWLAVASALALSGCKDTPKRADVDAEVGAELPADDSAEDLLARRDSLLSARARIRKERQEIEEQRRQVLSTGGDTSALDRRASELDAEEQKLGEQEMELNQSLGSYLKQRRQLLEQLAAQASSQNRAAAVQTFIASREKDIASRESQLAAREAALARREAELARREKETCGAASPTVIQAAPGASRYSKRDVVPLLRRARRDMSGKGILRSDLPAGVQSLEDEATEAMGKGDYGRAHFAASQLVRSVKGIRIDKSFIAAKIGRLNAAMKGKKLSGAVDAEVNQLFRQATANFGDGRFRSANTRLNKIYSLIR